MKHFRTNRIAPILRRAVLDCLAVSHVTERSWINPDDLFESQVVLAIKEEIVRAGKKLWDRQYVDGNGGNITARISPEYVISTPSMCSKGDLKAEGISLVDMQSYQICGNSPRTSEILLHLEIYKAVPEAKAVIHCHPPYATAHALAGLAPQGNLLPEHEVFNGPVAVTPYETPGTIEFARTVLPVVKQHNTILLENHGVVCWADTVTHAEWCVEVIETYCKTVMLAGQLRSPLKGIPSNKIADLLGIKQKLGLPDARYSETPDLVGEELSDGLGGGDFEPTRETRSPEEIDQFIDSLAAQIADFFTGIHEQHS